IRLLRARERGARAGAPPQAASAVLAARRYGSGLRSSWSVATGAPRSALARGRVDLSAERDRETVRPRPAGVPALARRPVSTIMEPGGRGPGPDRRSGSEPDGQRPRRAP